MTASRVVESIEAFADEVARYLMPTIRWVGHKDETFESLARSYPGLIHERDASGEPADLVIFDRLPIELLETSDRLSAESAYLFCLEPGAVLPPSLPDSLSRHIALTLLGPSTETLLWHMRSLLLMRDLSYAVGSSGFPELLSIDRDHRRRLAAVVNAVLDGRSCILTVPNVDYRAALLDFLFGGMPSSIAPAYIDPSRFAPELLFADRFNIVVGDNLSAAELSALTDDAGAREQRCSLMIIRVGNAHTESDPTADRLEVSLTGWAERKVDAHLIAYWASAWHSHRSGTVAYYSAASIDRIHAQSGHDPCAARNLFMESCPDETSPDNVLSELLETYRRLSMDSILDEVERQVMSRMREHSPVVEAASYAMGIPTTTYYKRVRRLSKRASLIELLASSRSP